MPSLFLFLTGLLTARNLLLAGRSQKPGFGGIHGGERGLVLKKYISYLLRNDTEVNCRETLQSKRDFIMEKRQCGFNLHKC